MVQKGATIDIDVDMYVKGKSETEIVDEARELARQYKKTT